MAENHIALVQCSFGHIVPIAGRVAECFCRRLFELDPSLRSRFAHDLEAYGHALTVVVEAIVSDLDHPRLVHSYSRTLARQCRRRGVRSQHYMTAGVALLGALRENLGEEFTPELEAAWAQVYAAIADAMQELAVT